MEAIIALVFLGAAYGLPVVIALGTAKLRQKRKLRRDLAELSESLGLVQVGDDLFGMHGGVAIGVRLAMDAAKFAVPRTTAFARLQPPLDLGLSISWMAAEIRDPTAGPHRVGTGDQRFDSVYAVWGDEPGRVRALLSPQLRATLSRTFHPEAMFLINDHGVAVQTWQHEANRAWLEGGVETCVRLATAIDAAREGVEVASPLREHKKAWTRFANHHALHGISAPLCMWGKVAGADIYTYSVRLSPGCFCLEVWLRFETPLGLGLLIQPKRTVDRVKDMFGGQDHLLGDALFDDTFVVRVSNTAAAEALLDDAMRKRLLTVHGNLGALSLTDDGLSVRLPSVPVDPAVVPATVEQLVALAVDIAKKRGQTRAHGPYRSAR